MQDNCAEEALNCNDRLLERLDKMKNGIHLLKAHVVILHRELRVNEVLLIAR